jgi:hypothetical protein
MHAVEQQHRVDTRKVSRLAQDDSNRAMTRRETGEDKAADAHRLRRGCRDFPLDAGQQRVERSRIAEWSLKRS